MTKKLNATKSYNLFGSLIDYLIDGTLTNLGSKNNLMHHILRLQLQKYIESGFKTPLFNTSPYCDINLNMMHILDNIEDHNHKPPFYTVKKNLIKSLINCAQACENCATECLNEGLTTSMMKCSELNQECVDVCLRAARLISTNSDWSNHVLLNCQTLCRKCAKECKKYNLIFCQVCAEQCTACAEACNRQLNN